MASLRSVLGPALGMVLLVGTVPPLHAQGDASIWSSAVPDFPAQTDLIPVGGSGQVNGGFTLGTRFDPDAKSAVQVGIRGQERFAGLLPQVGTVYFATTGTSGGGSGATWNYDLHLDFGTLEEDMLPENDIDAMPADASLEKNLRLAGLLGVGDELAPLNLRDFDVELLIDLDPSGATNFTATDLNLAVDDLASAFMVSAPTVRLFQTSLNLLFNVFGGGASNGFDPDVQGLYDFRLTVTDPTTQAVVARSAIQVAVGFPTQDTADVALTSTESADPVVVDDVAVPLVTTVTVTNQSATDTATGVVVTDTLVLPVGVSLTQTSATAGVVTGTVPDLTWTVGSLTPGASETLTLTLEVDVTAAVGDVVANAATAHADTPDDNLFNNVTGQTTDVACLDTDSDGVCNRDDNCPAVANPDQADTDGDGNGNACDLCFGDDNLGDDDGDGLCNDIDFCFGNEQTGDADQDGICADLDCDDNDPMDICLIFSDGFESGDLTKWSASVP